LIKANALTTNYTDTLIVLTQVILSLVTLLRQWYRGSPSLSIW